MPAVLQRAGEEPIFFKWILASPGEKGLDQIGAGLPNTLIAALPMSVLKHAQAVLCSNLPPKTPKWVQVAMGSDDAFRLVKKSNGDIRVVASREILGADDIIMVQGDMDDFMDVLTQGNKILGEKDWTLIFDDLRPDAQSGLVKWLFHQRTPEAAAIVERFLEDDS